MSPPCVKSRITRIYLFQHYYRKNYNFIRFLGSKKSYKVLFFGSDAIANDCYRKINEFRKTEQVIERLDLITSNNTKKQLEIEKYAVSENSKLHKWPLRDISSTEFDLGIIFGFGHMIKDDLLNKFPLGMINIHPSLLPRWRGAAPIIYTLLHGDCLAGVSLMKIKPNIFDVGDIISQKQIPVPKDIKLPELTKELSDIAADMLVECLRNLPDSINNAKPQSNEGITYAKKVNKSISKVRWNEMNAVEVYNLYRAIYGLYQIKTTLINTEIRLFGAFLYNAEEVEKENVVVGSLLYCQKTNAIKVLCKDRKYVYFRSLRLLGKKEISALDFYNGYIKNQRLVKSQLVCI